VYKYEFNKRYVKITKNYHPLIQFPFKIILQSGEQLRGVKLTTHLDQVTRLRMRGAIPPPHHTSSWRGA